MVSIKNKIKIFLDIIMTILMILLLNIVPTGLQLHEIIGLVVFALFIIHKLLNWSWIKGITKSIFNKKAKPKTVIMYILDVLLLICLTGTVLSGIFISKVLFVSITFPYVEFWTLIHAPLSYLSLIIISIHLGLHWKYIMASFRKMLRLKQDSKIRTLISRVIALIIVVLGIKSSIENDMAGKIMAPFYPTEKSTSEIKTTNVLTTSEQTDNEEVTATESAKATVSAQTVASTQTTATTQTLNQYLGSLHCTGCGKHCSLLYPQCRIGENQAAAAKVVYNKSVASTSTSSTTTSTATATATTEGSGTGKRKNATSQTHTTEPTTTTELTVIDPSDSIYDLFADYVPIMGVWIAGVHYLVLAKEKIQKKS